MAECIVGKLSGLVSRRERFALTLQAYASFLQYLSVERRRSLEVAAAVIWCSMNKVD